MNRILLRLFSTPATVLALAGAFVPVQAQEVDLSLRPIPPQIAAGQGIFVQVEATFPDTCTFGPEGKLDFAVNIIADDRVDAFYRTDDPGACGDALTYARAVFGPFPFESASGDGRMEISFTLERGDGLTGFGETVVEVVDQPLPVTPEAGFWWNPALSGHGLTIEAEGHRIFGALFSYDDSGQPDWRVFQAQVEGGLSVTDLLGFVGGNCLLCGEPWRAPGLLEDKRPLYLAFDGPAAAWMRIGIEPGLAIGLQRFHLAPVAQSGATTIPATVPDLAGYWIRIDGSGADASVTPTPVRVERLAEREVEGEVIYGFFEGEATPPTYTLSCGLDPAFSYGSCGFAHEVGDPGPPVILVPGRDIGTARIVIEGLDARYLRLPGGD